MNRTSIVRLPRNGVNCSRDRARMESCISLSFRCHVFLVDYMSINCNLERLITYLRSFHRLVDWLFSYS